MEEKYHNDLYRVIKTVLRVHGEIVQIDSLTAIAKFSDERIEIRAILNEDRSIRSVAVCLYLAYKHPKDLIELATFGWKKVDLDALTHVYLWQENVLFFRNGQWPKYIASLSRKIEVEVDRAKKQHNEPIDDSDVIPFMGY